MIERASVSDAARLDELAAVTADYARYSRTAYGGAFVGTSAVLLGALAAELLGYSAFARFAYLLLPAAWLLLLACARAYYQRHGVVVEPAQRVSGRGWILGFVYFMCASMVVSLAARLARRAADHGTGVLGFAEVIGFGLVMFGLVAVPLLTAEVVRGKLDAAVTLFITLCVVPWASQWAPPPALPGSEDATLNAVTSVLRMLFLGLVAPQAVGLLVLGVRDHVRYRRVERRLASLKGPA
jgi:hypothetical protein